MDLPDFLYRDDDHEVRVRGHRLRLIDVAARCEEGHSPEAIATDVYPTLDLPLAYKVVAFYLEHKPEVKALMAQNCPAGGAAADNARPGRTAPSDAGPPPPGRFLTCPLPSCSTRTSAAR